MLYRRTSDKQVASKKKPMINLEAIVRTSNSISSKRTSIMAELGILVCDAYVPPQHHAEIIYRIPRPRSISIKAYSLSDCPPYCLLFWDSPASRLRPSSPRNPSDSSPSFPSPTNSTLEPSPDPPSWPVHHRRSVHLREHSRTVAFGLQSP